VNREIVHAARIHDCLNAAFWLKILPIAAFVPFNRNAL